MNNMKNMMVEENGVVLGKFIKSSMIQVKNRLVLKITYKNDEGILSKQYETSDVKITGNELEVIIK